jgi:hypothetical protein
MSQCGPDGVSQFVNLFDYLKSPPKFPALLRGKDMLISRIAFGIPLGGDLKYIDSMTLKRSLDNRASCDS